MATRTAAGRGSAALVVLCAFTLLVPFALLALDASTCGLGLECACPHHGGRPTPPAPAGRALDAGDCHDESAASEGIEACRLRSAPRSDPGRLAALFDLSEWLSLAFHRLAPPWSDRAPPRPETPPPQPAALA